MAWALVVTLEKELADAAVSTAYSKAAGGKALMREIDRLDSAARRKNVSPITSLLSESQADLRAKLEADGFDPSKMRLPSELWFDSVDGLKSIRAIAEYVGANLNDFKQPNPILRDLKAAEALLTAASTAGVKFHFTKKDV